MLPPIPLLVFEVEVEVGMDCGVDGGLLFLSREYTLSTIRPVVCVSINWCVCNEVERVDVCMMMRMALFRGRLTIVGDA